METIFKFTFVEQDSGKNIKIPFLPWSFLDLDADCTCESTCGTCDDCYGRGREILTFDTDDVVSIIQDPSSSVCQERQGSDAVFTSSVKGGLKNNPTDPLALTKEQISLAIGEFDYTPMFPIP